jgi:hypothetical protein
METLVGIPYLQGRLSLLRTAQNADGGWGYFPGKKSWLEPTAYAAMALHGEPAADRAWDLLKSWQAADGSWRPSADVPVAHWGAALCVTLAAVREDFGDPFRKGAAWLINTAGAESALVKRVAARLGLLNTGRDLSLKGWPWKPNTTSWVEPTAHSLVALKKASVQIPGRDLRERIRLGEAQLLDVRCRDGGWNMGSSEALGVDLPSYPETTALALFGLQGRPDLAHSFELVKQTAYQTSSPLARAWTAIALRVHGTAVPAFPPAPPSSDILIAALEALGSAEGNYALLRSGGAA